MWPPSTKPRPFGRGDSLVRRQVERVSVPSTKPRPFGRGDEAPPLVLEGVRPPSTKPRPFGRGDDPVIGDFARGQESLQRSHDLSAVETRSRIPWQARSPTPFNEATTFRPWRHIETVRPVPGPDPSTKPRPFGRGDPRIPAWRRPTFASFNEATTFRPWRRGRHPSGPPDRRPSTKPRPFGRGDPVVLTSAHGSRGPSTKPRPFGRGDCSHTAHPRRESPPSTKPRPFGRGDTIVGFGIGAAILLQRSHDLSAVETSSTPPSATRTPAAFNEATTFRPWRPVAGKFTFYNGVNLQRSHDLSAVETTRG